VKTVNPLVISLISQENLLAWASPVLGLLAGAKCLVTEKEKRNKIIKKKESEKVPPIEAVYIVCIWLGGVWERSGLISPFLFDFGCSGCFGYSPLSPWRFFLNVGLVENPQGKMSRFLNLLAIL
jgi:hypothetical protein